MSKSKTKMKFNGKFNLPKRASSRLESVPETSVASTSRGEPSVTTAVKSMAHVLLGPTGRTPIDNIIHMQHFQLWGFLLVVAGLLYIVWLMQKKLDAIDKQYKEQFVLLHRLFKSHQDLQVEVRKTSARLPTAPARIPSVLSVASVPSVPSVPSVADVEIDEPEETPTTLELAEEPELCFEDEADNEVHDEVDEEVHDVQEEESHAEWNEPVEEVVEEVDASEQASYETFE
jgi:hypothetical protein